MQFKIKKKNSQALEVRDEDRPLYVVELKDNASSPQVEMYKELIHQGLALADTKVRKKRKLKIHGNLRNVASNNWS